MSYDGLVSSLKNS